MEHFSGLSRDVVIRRTGIDPVRMPDRINEAYRALGEWLEVDLNWGGGLPDGTRETFDWEDGETVKVNRKGQRCVQWGVFATTVQEDGRHFLDVPKPASAEEALAFDPLEHFPESEAEYELRFREAHRKMEASCGEACLPLPHHYTTAFHWPLAIFGFELLCEAGMEERPFHRLMERFAEVTRRICRAWARVPGLRGFILHDDLTMTSGPIFAPDWYRRHVFCFYPEFFRIFRDAGVPVIFTSDGDCTCFVDDIFAAGADGLNFEYLVDLERLVARHPDRILIGNLNTHTVAGGPIARIEREVRRCLSIGARAPRFVVNVGGGLAHDIPHDHLAAYVALRRDLCRSIRGG